jgi:hypothetical protein
MVTLVWSAVACIVLGAILMYAGREPSEDERDVESPLPSCSDGIWDYQHAAPGADFTENGVPYVVGEQDGGLGRGLHLTNRLGKWHTTGPPKRGHRMTKSRR